MKKMNSLFFFIIIVAGMAASCTNTPVKDKPVKDSTIVVHQDRHKPPATIQDTLLINSPAAIFYYPDSLQLLNIKAVTDTMVYESSMHEYFYQMRNGRAAIRAFNPRLKIIEAKNKRYLLFIKADQTRECIDLNTKDDAYGLFVFDGIKSPGMLDMTNIDRGLWFYFSEKQAAPPKK